MSSLSDSNIANQVDSTLFSFLAISGFIVVGAAIVWKVFWSWLRRSSYLEVYNNTRNRVTLGLATMKITLIGVRNLCNS